MLRSILPSSNKRNSNNAQFEIVEKENLPGFRDVDGNNRHPSPPAGKLDAMIEKATLDKAFDTLLTDLQIPPMLRPKLTGMDPIVKSAMLRSAKHPPVAAIFQTPRTLRKTKSSEGLESPRAANSTQITLNRPPLKSKQSASQVKALKAETVKSSTNSSKHDRGSSLNLPRSRSVVNLNQLESVKESKLHDRTFRDLSPQSFENLLTSSSSLVLEVESVKKLRLMLRNEPTNWTEDFMKCGGYTALLTRLNELLEIEWREEQHDDMLLHEILRCIKALSTSVIGCFALRSQSPRPFIQLVALLYSDKKPGDIASRQVIVELLLILFDLYPPSTPNCSGRLPHPHQSTFALVRSLLLTSKPPSAEALVLPDPVAPHDFISSIHQPRIFKNYLQELSDICRDYFWVFCHPQNTIWYLDEVDEAKVEKPKAPGGMTGGVEYEAMGYLTMHLRLINALSIAATISSAQEPRESELSRGCWHSDLFASGIERILLTARKASTTYYPTVHLEIARYVDHAKAAKFELPWTLARVIGVPPSGVKKQGQRIPARNSPARMRTTVPMLPSPQRVEPIQM